MRETMGGREVSANRYANGARRRALVARVRAIGEPCHICGLPIPPDAPPGTPLAFELDELVPVSKGGSPIDPGNVAPSHRCCNAWRGNKSIDRVTAIRSEVRARFGPWPSALAFCEGARAALRGAKGRISKAPVRHPKRSSGAL